MRSFLRSSVLGLLERGGVLAVAVLVVLSAAGSALATTRPGERTVGSFAGSEGSSCGPSASDTPSASAPATSSDETVGGSEMVQDAADVGSLVGIWCVGSVGSQPVGEVVATVEFSGDGRVQGNGGVNTFHGSYEVVDGQVQFGPIAATLIAGSGPAADVESRLFAVLVGTQPFVLDGDGLTIGSGENAAELHRVSATAAADLVVVSGTVTYRERMALPPDSVLVVQVLDAPADAAATIVAEVVVTPTSQVPIAYAVALDRGTFDLGQHYTLSAQISVGDDVLFTSTGDVPVLPEPPAQTINLVLTRG